jgi:polar amino acid transport system substrate-binding protein
VDISVNVKSTDALQESVSFNTIPFDNLTLNFYTNVIEKDSNKKVATIKGYDYGGFRQHLIDQGYELLDVPNLEDAVRIFANKRTKYLISYGGPVTHYFESETSNKGSLKPANIDTELLLSIPTYIAISKASQHHDLLVDIFKELDSKSEIPYIERD